MINSTTTGQCCINFKGELLDTIPRFFAFEKAELLHTHQSFTQQEIIKIKENLAKKNELFLEDLLKIGTDVHKNLYLMVIIQHVILAFDKDQDASFLQFLQNTCTTTLEVRTEKIKL